MAGQTAAVYVPVKGRGHAITVKQAIALRQLVFGATRPLRSFEAPWSKQGFCFYKRDPLQYGLVQHSGGPCGPLAVVQANVLKQLLASGDGSDWVRPTAAQQQRALAEALGDILWLAGASRGRCVVAVESDSDSDSMMSTSHYRPDNITERLMLYPCPTRERLRDFLTQPGVVQQFMAPRGFGVVLLVYSAMLSRGIGQTREDMASALGEAPTLMGQHSYAGQELVNLLLSGKAVPQVFDGERTLEDSSGSDSVVLRGIPSRCAVGFLTLFEHFGYMEVGQHLKTPQHPLWVVCSESHYSVFFRPRTPTKGSGGFDLYYYDGLAQQDEEIRLTVTPSGNGVTASAKADGDVDLTPPLNHCIHTKWPESTVDWNGTEALL